MRRHLSAGGFGRMRRRDALTGYGGGRSHIGDLARPSRGPLPWGRLLLVPLVVLLVVGIQLVRPVPEVDATAAAAGSAVTEGAAPALPWPAKGAAAVGVSGLGLIGESDPAAQSRPIASVAKVMTALVVLDRKPLEVAQPGPVIDITPEDVAARDQREAEGESTVAVAVGAGLTQRQALEALLIPSGNNVGEILARWAAGSPGAFVDAMNAKAKQLGLSGTHFADVSGVDPGTRSIPRDLVRLAMVAMDHPVIAEIVPMPQTTVPTAGVVYNVNSILGQEGIFGIKTGWTSSAGGCFLFAARHQVDGRPVTIYGAVMGQDTLEDAFNTTKALIRSVRDGLSMRTIVATGQRIAAYEAPWGAHADVVAAEDVVAVGWPGLRVETDVAVRPIEAETPAGTQVGTVTVGVGAQTQEAKLVTEESLPAPGRAWRLKRLG